MLSGMAKRGGSTKPWYPPQTLAQRLREVRRSLSLTMEQMAERCGFNAKTYASWEAGSRPLDRDEVVAQVAQSTGVDRDWLMWGYAPRDSNPEPSDSRLALKVA